jgi:branched-chain amino acid transport system substrate-binding protein
MKRLIVVLLAVALVIPFAVGVRAQDPIKIGIITSITGAQARFGEAHKRGYELALEEINAAGGVLGRPLELVLEDDTSKPEQAQLAVEKLVNEVGVSVMIGAYTSSATLQAAAKANENEVPLVVPSSAANSITEKGYQWVFRVNAPSSVYAKTIMDFLSSVGDIKSVALVYEDTAFGSDTAKEADKFAKEAGFTVVASEKYEAGAPDFRPILTRVKDTNPDAIFFVSYLADATLLMQQSKELDLNVKAFAAGGAGFSLPEFPVNAGPNAEFTLSVTQWTPDVTWKGAAEFTKKFMERYQVEPQYHSAQAYASLYVVADAIARAGVADDPAAIRDALKATKLDGIFGPISFDEKGQNTHPMLVTQVVQGKFVTVFPEEFATVKAIYPAPKWADRATFVYPSK